MFWIYGSFIHLSEIKIGRHFLKGSYSSSGFNSNNNNNNSHTAITNNNETKPVSFACIERKRTAAVTAVKNNLYICLLSDFSFWGYKC